MSDFCENCNPHSSYHTTAVGECWVDIWFPEICQMTLYVFGSQSMLSKSTCLLYGSTAMQIHTMLYVYRHYDIAYRYIIVPNKSHTLCCRCKKASVFQAFKLEIYLKCAFNLSLCYYNTNLFQQCVHVWLDSGVKMFCWKIWPIFRQLNLWKSSVYVCCCHTCLVKQMRVSIKLIHNWPGSLKNNAASYDIRAYGA